MRYVNQIVMAVLRSPVHRIVSGRLLVLSYTGRRTGQRHAIPVGYVDHRDRLVVTVGRPDRKRWWRNLREPAAVRVLVRGEWFAAIAVVAEGSPTSVSITDLRPE